MRLNGDSSLSYMFTNFLQYVSKAWSLAHKMRHTPIQTGFYENEYPCETSRSLIAVFKCFVC